MVLRNALRLTLLGLDRMHGASALIVGDSGRLYTAVTTVGG